MTSAFDRAELAGLVSTGRREALRTGALLLGGLLYGCGSPIRQAQEIRTLPGGTPGDIARTLADFRRFSSAQSSGTKPNLPRRVGFVSPTTTEYMASLSDACGAACKARGLDFIHAVSDGDPVKNADQLDQMLNRGIAGLVIPPLDTAAQSDVAIRAIEAGVCVMFLVSSPTTSQTMSFQHRFGEAQARAAVDWIRQHLRGHGKVAYFNRDQFEALQPRTTAVIALLKQAGIDLVYNGMDERATQADGFRLASLLAQSHPDINVWIGEDDTMLGVDAYLQSVGRNPAMEPLALISVGGTSAAKQIVGTARSFLRTVIASADPLGTFACASFCADWLEGSAIPQVIEVRCEPLSSQAEVAAYDARNSDLARAFDATLTGAADGVRYWGAVNFDTRSNYLRNILS